MVRLIIGLIVLIFLILFLIKLKPSKDSALHRNLKKKTVDTLRIMVILGILGVGLYLYSECFPQGLGSIKDGKFSMNAPKLTLSRLNAENDTVVISIRLDKVTLDGEEYGWDTESSEVYDGVSREVPNRAFDEIVCKAIDQGKRFAIVDDYALNDIYISVYGRLLFLGVTEDSILQITGNGD